MTRTRRPAAAVTATRATNGVPAGTVLTTIRCRYTNRTYTCNYGSTGSIAVRTR